MTRPLSIICFFVLHNFVASVTVAEQGQLLVYPMPNLRPLKQSLGFNEDTYLNFTELTTKYGYSTEEHIVTTQDGYILTVYRMLPKCNPVKRYPVILMHGMMDSSDAWILPGPEAGIGYILSNNCYDVWIPNHRGNTYSRKHISLNPDRDAQFWEFSFEEVGTYDLPALIDYILDVTQQSKTYYICHSQGATDYFVMGSMLPEYNSKIQLSIHLAPVVWMKYVGNPLLKLVSPNAGFIEDFLRGIGIRELLARHQILHQVLEFMCQVIPVKVCGTILVLFSGASYQNTRPETLTIAFGHLLAGVSVKTLSHYAQLIVSQEFQRYNEGREGNLARYGTLEPPKYNVSLVTSPVVLMAANSDWLSDLRDVDFLSTKLPNLVDKYVVADPTWSHNDYLWGDNSVKYVTSKMLDYLETYKT